MRLARWLAAALLLLPAAEIFSFILVAAWIGWAAALALLVLLSLAGLILLRRQGQAQFARFRRAMADPGGPATILTAADAIPAFAGILLLLPGFVTAVAGLLLLLMGGRRGAATFGRSEGPAGGRAVVDLAPDEWHRVDPGRHQMRDK
jgi:UPF0716 protein FxsA